MPRLLANRELPLPRFWIPFAPDNNHDAPHTLFLNDGILPDPEDSYGKVANRSLTTLAIIAQKRCFALLGQPGLGKSITVKQWVDDMGSRALPGDLVVLLRSVELASEDDIRRDTIETPQWREARMRDGEITLVLDGLDEALQRLPVLLHRLRKCLEDEPVARTRLALVSRVADWRESRADELFALWPEHERGGAFELCPLRWKDVRLAATESGVNADAFTRAVCERRVGWMAGRPKLLMMLIEEFQRFRRLPDNRRELFARAARRMSDEHDPERHEIIAGSGRPVVPVERAHAVVARISAAMLLCGKSRVLMDSRIPPDGADLPLAELIGGAEPLGADSFDVDERHVRAALDTAHFVANGPARIGFDHQSMTEFMTAEYLSRCTAPQLRSLLTQRVDGADFLLPQFREISAWLASHHREFRADVLAHEPRLLIEADAVELDEPARREAVAALLAQMDREEAFDVDESESFLRSLRPAPLARQLRPWIVDETRNVVVRRTAIRLAGIARCRALRDDLWKLLAEPQQTSIHSSIIDALQRMGTPADRANFLRALRGEFGLDPQDEMKGAALKFLVPRHLPVRDVLDYLTPRADDFFGNYWIALEYDLPRAIRVADVLPILERTTRLGKNGGFVGALLPVTKAALKLAFPHFGNSRVCEASIRLLAELAGQSSWEGAWASVRPDGLSSKEEAMLRLAVLESFVVRARGQFRAFVQFGLWPHPDDLGWVLEKVRAAREPQRSLWADLTCQLLFRGLPEKLRAQFLRTYRSVKALREKLPKSRRFDLIETIERRARAVQRRHELWERRSKRRTAAREVGKLTIGNILEQLHAGRAGWWGYFVRVLIRSHSESPQTELQNKPRAYAIATWDGWKELTAADRKIALNMAAEFLRAAPVPIREFGKLFSIDESAVLAIVLLRSRLSRDPKLREIVRGKWTPAVLHGLYNGEPELDAATKFVCALDRRACLAWCSEELNYEQQKDSEFSSLRRFKHCWDTGFTSVVTRFALARGRTPRALLSAFTLLRDVAPNDARELWRKLHRHATRRKFGKCERMIAFIGLFGLPVDGWEASITRLRRSSRAARIRFFAEHAGLLDYHFRAWSSAFNDSQLADLYLLLVDLFPPRKLRDYTRGGSVHARDHIGDMQRACIGSLVQRGSASACASLRRIAGSVPDDERIWIRWKLREAIDQRLRTEWARDQPAPSAILRMTRAATAARVRDEGELQDAVLASLTRLQAAMRTGQFPKIPNFWREPGTTPHLEREIARRIAEWFDADLRGDAGLVVDREPQVGWNGNMDIKIEVPANRAAQRPRLVIVVEVKRCMHDKVRTACATQLAEGYLRRKNLTHGIYLVTWFDLPASKVRWPSAEAAQDEVAGWASSAAIPPLAIRGFVLDCRWLGLEAPSGIQTKPRVNSGVTGESGRC